jgi:hypothetical protein
MPAFHACRVVGFRQRRRSKVDENQPTHRVLEHIGWLDIAVTHARIMTPLGSRLP